MIEQKIKGAIRDVPDFPKPGILFKDITPILKDPALCGEIVDAFANRFAQTRIDGIAGVESRGFLFGLMLAAKLGVPFLPVRKAGKLPFKTLRHDYDLEYGSATLELHTDAFAPGQHILIHDDLLATGGTVAAASALVRKLGGEIAGYAFLVTLEALGGSKPLQAYSSNLHSLVTFP
ncbi:MAG: adenine phosphoribosyltransferase [Mucilaginibacter polytrichastri]|nr:adenine phosphoribosyltransferase [Mucilaginibacter polytrichastri]